MRKRPTVTGASVPRRKSFAIKGDTGLFQMLNREQQKASIVDGVRTIEDSMRRPEGGEPESFVDSRYISPEQTKASNPPNSIHKVRDAEHYDPFWDTRIIDAMMNFSKSLDKDNNQ